MKGARVLRLDDAPLFKPTKRPRADDADHYALASEFIEHETERTGSSPVYCFGKFCTHDTASGLWSSASLDRKALDVGALLGGRKFCKRLSDFRAIAQLATDLVEDAAF